jgi:DNA polymerase-3 subunit gamma/tau
MSHISLYRKYRPTNFSKIIGQEYVVKSLCNSIVNEKVGHAYIFNGSRGCGKTSIAKIFAKAANCLTPINGDACNKCENCQFINNLQTVDVQEIDAASHNGVEEIRKINESVNFLPVGLKKKIYIIDEAHMLTTQS